MTLMLGAAARDLLRLPDKAAWKLTAQQASRHP
jgi:hypothetical protein